MFYLPKEISATPLTDGFGLLFASQEADLLSVSEAAGHWLPGASS